RPRVHLRTHRSAVLGLEDATPQGPAPGTALHQSRRGGAHAGRLFAPGAGGIVAMTNPLQASILIVDDDRATVMAMQEMLRCVGAKLVTAASGEEALRRVVSFA